MGVIDSTLLVKVTVGFNFFGNAHVAVAVAMQKQEEPKKVSTYQKKILLLSQIAVPDPRIDPIQRVVDNGMASELINGVQIITDEDFDFSLNKEPVRQLMGDTMKTIEKSTIQIDYSISTFSLRFGTIQRGLI